MSRLVWLDSLRLIAGVSMIGLHATSDAAGQPFVSYEPAQRIAPMIIRAVVYTARTELFLIISIFLLLMALDKKPRNYRFVMRQQTQRLLIPFVFWTVFYAFFNMVKANHFGYLNFVVEQIFSWKSWVGYLLLGDVKYHMHFLPTLFALVLLFPLYQLAADRIWIGFCVILLLFFKREIDVFLWSSFSTISGFDYVVRAVKIAAYSGYGFVAGSMYGIWRNHTQTLAVRWTDYTLTLSVIVLVGIKLWATQKIVLSGEWQHNFTAGYWADFLMPIVLFACLMRFASSYWPPILSKLAPFSFGIYLCHPIFMDFSEILISGLVLSPISQVVLKILLVTASTSIFVWCVSQLRISAWTIGLGQMPDIKIFNRNRGIEC